MPYRKFNPVIPFQSQLSASAKQKRDALLNKVKARVMDAPRAHNRRDRQNRTVYECTVGASWMAMADNVIPEPEQR